MAGGMYTGPARALEELVLELEALRRRVPEAILEGEAEEVLGDAYTLLSSLSPSIGLLARPYVGLPDRVRLLAQLATALRVRMLRAGTPYITDTAYFIDKLDDLIMEVRYLAGLHPYLPMGGTGYYKARS